MRLAWAPRRKETMTHTSGSRMTAWSMTVPSTFSSPSDQMVERGETNPSSWVPPVITRPVNSRTVGSSTCRRNLHESYGASIREDLRSISNMKDIPSVPWMVFARPLGGSAAVALLRQPLCTPWTEDCLRMVATCPGRWSHTTLSNASNSCSACQTPHLAICTVGASHQRPDGSVREARMFNSHLV